MSYQISGVDVINDSRHANVVSLEVSGTGAVKLPIGTTAQRPTPALGQLRFNTTTNRYEGYNGSQWGDLNAPSIYDYVYVNSTFTMTDNQYVFADTTNSSFLIRLPATPTEGTVVFIADYAGTFSGNNLTVNGNASTILGSTSNIVIDSSYEYTFYYINGDWRIYINKTFFFSNLSGESPLISGSSTVIAGTNNEYRIVNFAVSNDYTLSATGGLLSALVVDVFTWTAPNVQSSTNYIITVNSNGVADGTITVTVLPLSAADDDVITYTESDFGTGTTYTNWTI